MRNLNHFTKGWHICKRLSFVALLGLVLGIAFQSPLVQAQDSGGQQAFVAYELIISDNLLDRFCVGQTEPIPFKVRASAVVVGAETAGRVRVLGNVTTTLTSQNPAIASVALSTGRQGAAPDVPFEIEALVTGTNVGRTSIVVEVSAQSINRFGTASSFQLRGTIPVNVVPCEYKVTMSTFWTTQMYSADVMISTRINNAPLTSESGVSFSNDTRFNASTYAIWSFMTNRLKGCDIGHNTFNEQGTQITGLILDDELSGTISLAPLPTSSNLYIQCHRPTPAGRVQSCDDYPDGTCHPANEGGRDSFMPASIEFQVPVSGGTVSVPHSLTHSQGSATGVSTITITPVRR